MLFVPNSRGGQTSRVRLAQGASKSKSKVLHSAEALIGYLSVSRYEVRWVLLSQGEIANAHARGPFLKSSARHRLLLSVCLCFLQR